VARVERVAVMPDGEAVALDVATPDEGPVLAQLLELYVHDMSEFFDIAIGSAGRFGYARLPLYGSEPDRHLAFLIRAGGQLAGFVLVTRGSPGTDGPDDLDVAEFFVLRAHRRAGVGRKAAALLWRRMPGHWVVRVAEWNRPALAFWRSTVRACTGGAFSETRRTDDARGWCVFRFTSGDPRAE